MAAKGKIGIVGSGLIGRSWAMLFASANYKVALYDSNPEVVESSLAEIKDQLKNLEKIGLLRGSLNAQEQYALIEASSSLSECVKDAVHIQECVFENADLKKSVFKQLDELASDQMTLCSSTSCIMPSTFSEDLVHRSQVIVAHPANPPYYVPIVEIVSPQWTSPSIIEKTVSLMKEIGQKPVVCKKEIYGFVINRMQYAIINECWRLVEDGIMSVEDVDAVMSEGLGLRYALLGVFETCHLNADGMLDYCRRYGKGIYNVSQTFGPVPKMGGPTAEKIHGELSAKIPLSKISERRKWRDDRLAQLARLKRIMDEKQK